MLLAALACVTSGCAHNVLYDENRDKQAQAAKKAADETKLAPSLVVLEKTLADMAAREEASVRDRQIFLFDKESLNAAKADSLGASGPLKGLQFVVDERLKTLGASNEVTGDKVTDHQAQLRARVKALQERLIEFQGSFAHKFETCDEVKAASANREQFLKGLSAGQTAGPLFDGLVTACGNIDQTLAERNAIFKDGLIAKAQLDLDKIEREVIDYEAKRQAAKDQLNKAIADFEGSGVEAATQAGASKLKSLEERLAALRDVVAVLAAGNSFLGLAGSQVVAGERLNHLDKVLAAAAGSSADGSVTLTKDEQVAVAIVRDIPALADEADKLLRDAKKPRLVPFLAAIDYQKLVVRSFQAAQDARTKEADAKRKHLDAMLNEGMALLNISSTFKANDTWSTRSLTALDRSLSPTDKRKLYRALAFYGDDVRGYRIDAAVWTVRAQAARYEGGLAQSKFSAAQWDGLTEMMATVLVDYHAAGIKQSDLAEFFKALGLVVIGVGVAQ
jgi:hypothetical protein